MEGTAVESMCDNHEYRERYQKPDLDNEFEELKNEFLVRLKKPMNIDKYKP